MLKGYTFLPLNPENELKFTQWQTITPCLKKTKPLLFFEKLCETSADFNNFWHATSQQEI